MDYLKCRVGKLDAVINDIQKIKNVDSVERVHE